MALAYSQLGKIGSVAPNFNLLGVDGKMYSLDQFQDSTILIIAFICNHCPYVIAVQERINSLARSHRQRGVQWVAINSNDSTRYPEDGYSKMVVRAKDQGYIFPYLHDANQEVARAYGAVCTPDFFVYSGPSRVLQYQGRLDDSWKDESLVKTRDLADAVDALLLGKVPNSNQVPSMGCSIKWKV